MLGIMQSLPELYKPIISIESAMLQFLPAEYRSFNVMYYNDCGRTKHANILAVFDKTIAHLAAKRAPATRAVIPNESLPATHDVMPTCALPVEISSLLNTTSTIETDDHEPQVTSIPPPPVVISLLPLKLRQPTSPSVPALRPL